MASLYYDEHRALQEEYNTVKLAERLDTGWVHDEIGPDEAAFIGSRDMFFLSTVDPDGMPTVSYKGGSTGFVKVLDANTLVFPGLDGNGMWYSMGNIEGQSKVGLLFIDFETPHPCPRPGTRPDAARRSADGRIHRGQVPREDRGDEGLGQLPALHPQVPEGFRRTNTCRAPTRRRRSPYGSALDMVGDVISDEDKARVEKEGQLALPEYEARVARGES